MLADSPSRRDRIFSSIDTLRVIAKYINDSTTKANQICLPLKRTKLKPESVKEPILES